MIRQAALAGHANVDVSELSDQGAFGHKGLIWWGTVGFMVIEGSMFVMALITYFYLRLRVEAWPPVQPNPDLLYGTLNIALLLVSAVPNHLAKVAGERFELGAVRFWMWVCVLFGVALLVLRGFEFARVNCRWDENAYGSIVWCLLVMHTIHLATDVVDTGVLAALMMTESGTSKKRFIDVSENGLYWYFIVLWWVPIYLTIYWAPRWL